MHFTEWSTAVSKS